MTSSHSFLGTQIYKWSWAMDLLSGHLPEEPGRASKYLGVGESGFASLIFRVSLVQLLTFESQNAVYLSDLKQFC